MFTFEPQLSAQPVILNSSNLFILYFHYIFFMHMHLNSLHL